MYARYLRRELAGRKKQTVIVASGLALAIALVMIVSSLAAGVRDAQAQALESVYGVGTDLTVSGAQAEPGEGGRGQQFDFDEDAGSTDDEGTTSLAQSQLTTERFRSTLDASVLDTVLATDGVSAATGTLALTNTTFSGELPERPDEAESGAGGQAPPEGGADGGGGFGGGAFDLDSFSVMGVETDAAALGPLSAVSVEDGRGLAADDAGARVAVVDATYAATAELAVGSTLEIAGDEFEVVGIVASTSDEADTASNVYIPLDVAQELSGVGDVLSTVYVQAATSDAIAAVQAELEESLPDATISSQSDLASTVSGSLSSASALITNLGTWLSAIVLVVALALAVLFTISGVSRRTREFGTLKAIGWSNGRVVGQVAGESVVQSLIGGAAGLVIGLIGIGAINLMSPTISTSSAATTPSGPGGAEGAGGPGGQAFGQAAAQNAADIVLQAPITLWVVAAAIGLSMLGGLLAGAFGGWRASRLSPAEALRSVG
ncbi:ABC transporter permease [Microbacterium xanthum]|uniref:ABC transporter permease n=1 Tax=Microbacterium xanthum TaxID=3079794 RepID=UPI002AD2E6FF|nr:MULTISPECIES: ABC transporter permease [unclassified Microbacterium]MDZ8172037.1 ABC transporter permease [Microbacterium sp. KSW-48]MDZ8202256.1 ABC transporter permease [Microbacterium sp. SSW1-59]